MKTLGKYINDQYVELDLTDDYYEYIENMAIENLGIKKEEKDDYELEIKDEMKELLADEFYEEYENLCEEATDFYDELSHWFNSQTGV